MSVLSRVTASLPVSLSSVFTSWDLSNQELREKIQKVFTYILYGVALEIATGFFFGGAAAVAVGIGGLVALVARSLLSEDPQVKLRRSLLQPFQTVFQADSKASQALARIAQVVKVKTPCFAQTYDHHAFHHELVVISEAVQGREELKPLWRSFLQSLEGLQAYFPDGSLINLEFGLELDRLDGKTVQFEVEQLNPAASDFRDTLKKVTAVQRECFTRECIYSESEMNTVLNHYNGKCYVARRRETRDILAFIWTFEMPVGTEKQLLIASVGRKPGMARLGVVQAIFNRVLSQDLSPFKEVVLQVRESNKPAIELYKKNRFEEIQRLPRYYSYPVEDAHLMRFNQQLVSI